VIRKPESPLGQIASIVFSVISLGAAALVFFAIALVPKEDGYAWRDVQSFGIYLVIAVVLVLLGLFLYWFGTPDDIDPYKRRMRLLVFQITVGVLFGLPTLSWLVALTHLVIAGHWRFH
jgi:hypothetical protein